MAEPISAKIRLALGTFAAATVMWIFAGFWHNDLGPGLLNGTGTHLSAKSLSLTFLAFAILASIFARVYSLLPEDRRTVIAGLRIGVYGGIIWSFPHALLTGAGAGEPIAPVLLHTLVHMVEEGLGGTVMALIYHLQAR
ncbi:hypothetical protein ACP2AV_15195 [Aliiroseovarius sp. PTFE2010]|uniref:hypothetical protein n=1 Tax=Aliiroseovarius sp. PTFE2010 TaxID=3417190 RepID=UPI003CE7795E